MTARPPLALAALLAALSLTGPPAAAETVTPIASRPLPNVPGKAIVAVTVDYPPGGATPAHTHARSAFVLATVVSGAVESAVDDGPVRTYRAGESFSEAPGNRHRVSRNASATEPARLLAVFVLDADDGPLTTIDAPPASHH